MQSDRLKMFQSTVGWKSAPGNILVCGGRNHVQEYLKLMHLGYLRINFFTRNAQTGNEDRLNHLLP